jgi:hypothetical protein
MRFAAHRCALWPPTLTSLTCGNDSLHPEDREDLGLLRAVMRRRNGSEPYDVVIGEDPVVHGS